LVLVSTAALRYAASHRQFALAETTTVNQTNPDRREFAKKAALLAAAPLLSAAPATAAQASDLPAAADTLAAQAAALTAIVRGRHGKHLTDEQLKRVQQSIHARLQAAQVLRQFPLTNHDEPAFVFQADLP
jgi:hypothetical protein